MAHGAPFAAAASVEPTALYVNDAGTVLTFTVHNTGTSAGIGAVEISAPSSSFSVVACPQAPAGWSTQTASNKCRYRSATTTADDIAPGAASNAFKLTAATAGSKADYSGTWKVVVSKSNQFDDPSKLSAAASEPPGLTTKVHSFEILDAVVADSAATPGGACPAPSRQAIGGTTHVIVICGKNRASGTLTPTAARSSLAGTFIATPGTFSSGPIAARSSSSRVLGNWSGATVSGSKGTGKTIVTKTGASNKETSPLTTLGGYEITNQAPTVDGQSVTVTEDVTKTITLAADDEDGDAVNFAIDDGPDHGTLEPSGTVSCSGTPSHCTRDYLYTPDEDYNGTDGFAYTASDGFATSASATVSITITAVNDAPVVTTSAGSLSYTEGDDATGIDTGVTVADIDSASIVSATVQITGNYANGQDVLALPMTAGILASFDAPSGTLTLTGSASVAAYQAALRTVTYENTSSSPSTLARTVTFVASDGASSSAPATKTINITATDSPPDVETSAGALAYTENDPATAIDTAITVTDVDSANLTGATVQITGNYTSAEDVLALPSQPIISGSFAPATGTLTLSGTATVAAYETALEAVTYRNTSDDPSTATRTVTYAARDAGGFGTPDTHAITVTAVDDPPVAVNDAATVGEDSGASAIGVLGNDTDVDGGPKSVASVTQPANGSAAITGGGTGVSYTPNVNHCGSDSFTYTLNGGSTATVSVTVTCSDDAPTAVDDAATVTEDSGANALNVLANDTDPDGGPKSVASVTPPVNGIVVITGGGTGVSYTPNANYCNNPPGTSPDTFTYTLTPGGSTAMVSVTVTCTDDPPNAVNDAATVGEDSGANAIDVLANDTDADGGPKSVASVTQAANGSVAITGGGTGVSYTPNANYCGSDSFTYTLNGGSSATVSITVTCVNDAPVVITSAGTTSYTENATATAIDALVTVSDPDGGATITGATVAITTNYAAGQDVLALSSIHPGINAAQIGNTLSLTGTATPAAYESALRDVTYANTSEAPSTALRTVTFTATDSGALQGSDTKSLSVTAVNDPPTAVNDSGTTDEDTPLSVSAPGVLANDTDIDPGDTKTVVRLNGSLTLTGSSTEGGSVAINANGSYTYTPPAAFQALSTGQFDTDSFQYTMADGAGAQSTATVNLTVHGVSDAPTAVADSFQAIGNTGLFAGTTKPAGDAGREISGSVLANDTDPDTPQASLVAEPVTNAPTALGGTITLESDGNFTYLPDDGATATTDTFTYRVCDASPCNAGTVANATGTLNLPIAGQVWYVDNSQAAGGDGTSDAPFDTLVEAELASGSGDTVYVFDGNNTTANLDTGYVMEAGERLIGEVNPLTIDPDGGGSLPTVTLFPGAAGATPSLTASNEDVVSLASGVTVDGFNVDPSGSGGGIAGGPGAGGGTAGNVTVARVNVNDTATAGTQPGIDLDGTTGTNALSDVTVTNGGSATAVGVRINDAGTVNFSAAGTTTIATTGARALDAASTNMATSTFDDITVTGSATGAIRLSSNTGSTTLGDGAGTDLSLQTTSGATPALDVSSANSVQVGAGGTDAISATGGPAVDIRNSNGSGFDFDSVSSTNSATDGINLDTNLSTPFAAAAGAISGAAGVAFDVNGGGSGPVGVSYAGAINDGSGKSVEVTGRDGGTVTLSGNIADGADSGGGISVSGNSDGTTTFSGASKVINTGSADAVLMTGNANSALRFTGGGLDIDATSGRGLEASANSSGLIEVSGSGNSIQTGTGRALNVTNTPISVNDLTFERIAANGAANGIVLNNTGGAGRGLTVTGTGGACATTADSCTGGTIQSTTLDAISLTTTQDVVLNRMRIVDNLGNGIRGSGVTNFTLRDSVLDDNGDDAASDEAGLHLTNLAGNADITRVLVANSTEDNARIVNSSGTLSQLDVTDSTFRDTDTVSPGNNGLLLQADGGSITADVLGSDFLRNRANGLQVITNNTGSMNVEVDDSGTAQSDFDDNNIGVSIAHNSSGTFTYAVRDLTIDGLNVAPGTGGSASPINLNLAGAATTTMNGTVTGNTLTNSNSTTGPGIRLIGNGVATSTALLESNTISQVANRGIEVIARDGSNRINATIANNSVTLNNALSGDAIRVDSGAVSTDTTTICADIRGNTATTTAVGLFGIRVRQRFAGTSFILEGYAGSPTDDAAVQSLLSTNNNGATTSADHGGAGFTTIADCPTPP